MVSIDKLMDYSIIMKRMKFHFNLISRPVALCLPCPPSSHQSQLASCAFVFSLAQLWFCSRDPPFGFESGNRPRAHCHHLLEFIAPSNKQHVASVLDNLIAQPRQLSSTSIVAEGGGRGEGGTPRDRVSICFDCLVDHVCICTLVIITPL